MMNTRPGPAPDGVFRHPFHLAAVLVAMAALLWSFAAQDPWGRLLPQRVAVELDGQLYQVPERRLRALTQSAPDWLDEAQAEVIERLALGVDRELAQLFDRVHARVPEFADWYYSVPGVALRLLAAMPNPLWSGRETLLTRELTERLFPDDRWTAELEAMERAVGELHRAEILALEDRWLAWLVRELAPYRSEAPAPDDAAPIRFEHRLAAYLGSLPGEDRIGMHALAGLGGGALLARAAVGRVNAAAAGGRAAARVAARGSAGSGAAACGFSGPLAIGCAVAVFTGITLGTEWALLQADDALNRDALEQALHEAVEALRGAMEDDFAGQFLAAAARDMGHLDAGIRASLRPVDWVAGRTAP